MKKILLALLVLAISAFAQQQTSVAVLPSDGTALSDYELGALTDEMREAALKVLPTKAFVLLKQDEVIKRLGGAENYIKECSESSCIVNLGEKAQVDYVAQASVGKLDNKIRLKVELYSVRTKGLVGMFNDEAENIRGLLAIVKKRVPEVFNKIPGASNGKSFDASFAGGISGVQTTGSSYELDVVKRYVVNLNTEPTGAALSFDGVPRCPKTPCKVELREGSVSIIANLEQYEIADTIVSISSNNQNIAIKLKPNFGILEIKQVYSDGIGKDKQWNLLINDKSYSLGEIRLSPNKYAVRLNHECYENIGFDVGINKGKREIFDMANNITLKKGGLDLSAERNGEPVSEPVFVNGKQVGETPFNGAVPLCAKIEIGEGKEIVDVKLKYKETVKHTHKGTDKPSRNVDSSKSVEFSKPSRLKFGIGGTIDSLYFRNDVNFGNPNIEATLLTGEAFSLGAVMSIPFVNLLTFNPEFYLVYRTINDYECSTICQIIIKEFAINIPLIVSLEFAGETDDNIRIGGYIEAGASLDIPLSTSVNSNPEIYVDREKFNPSVVFGAGFLLGDFYFGFRGNIGIAYFDKNAGGKFNSKIFIARYFF